MQQQHIIQKAIPVFRAQPVIYFLIKGQEVVYIGKSTRSYFARIGAHIANPMMDFDSFYVAECPMTRLDDAENFYISKFKPIYNARGKSADTNQEITDNISEVELPKMELDAICLTRQTRKQFIDFILVRILHRTFREAGHEMGISKVAVWRLVNRFENHF